MKWREYDDSDQILTSPLILVPVKLTIESLTSPYVLSSHEDEIVVNPTLSHKLEHDFGIILPEFDGSKDDIATYLLELMQLVENKGWEITEDVNLTILSFLKINMYKDLERNEEKLNANQIITAIAGESESLNIPDELNNYDHDNNTKPIDTYQVVDADSSQQDAVLLSKSGASFVLQGPPGTGKSQTITNIISEALADGKKVLFVSEKMAALQVVHKRLTNVGLADFCFTLHSHNANKKEVLRELANSISIDRKRVREEAIAQLDTLERKRNTLNDYQRELHTPCSALNCKIYDINGKLAKLDHIPEIIFEIADVENTTQSELNDRSYLLSEFSKTVGKRSEDYSQNVWRNATVDFLSNELRHDIDSNVSFLLPQIKEIDDYFDECCRKLGLTIKPSLEGLELFAQLLSLVGKSPIIPTKWVFGGDVDKLLIKAQQYKKSTNKINDLQATISTLYGEHIFSINGEERKVALAELLSTLSRKLRFDSQDEVINNLERSLNEIASIADHLSELHSKSKEAATLIGVKEPSNLSKIKFIASLAEVLSVDVTPTDLWFDTQKFSQIGGFTDECAKQHQDIIKQKQNILQKFDKEVFEVDYYSILKRFRGEYGSMFRSFKSKL